MELGLVATKIDVGIYLYIYILFFIPATVITRINSHILLDPSILFFPYWEWEHPKI